jgi:hypothetical protein
LLRHREASPLHFWVEPEVPMRDQKKPHEERRPRRRNRAPVTPEPMTRDDRVPELDEDDIITRPNSRPISEPVADAGDRP